MELERNERPCYQSKFERPSKDGCQEQSLNHLMLHKAETPIVVNDKPSLKLRLTKLGKTGTSIPDDVCIGAE